MGICLHNITSEGPPMGKGEYHLANNWVWVVYRTTDPIKWHLQGIGADEEIAVQMCVDETYIIGPVPLNTSLPHNRIEWLGSYFPLKT